MSSALRRQFDPRALFERGRLYLGLGEYDKAAEDFARLLEAVPAVLHVRYLLGIAYKRGGQDRRAIAEFEVLASETRTGTSRATRIWVPTSTSLS